MEVVRRLNKNEGKTIIHITHYMEEAVEADRVLVMDQGRIVLEGTPREVFSKVNRLKELGLDVPALTELALKLRKKGVKLPDILTEEEMVVELCRLKLQT